MTSPSLDDDVRHRHRPVPPDAAGGRARRGLRRNVLPFAVRERQAPPRVLVMCGASVAAVRGDASGFQLARIAEEALDAAAVEADELDLGAVAAAYGRSLHLCEGCLARGADAEDGHVHHSDAAPDWTADLRERFGTVDALLLIAPVRGQELPIGVQPLFDALAAGGSAAAVLASPVERPCALVLQGDTGAVGQMLTAPLTRMGFATLLTPSAPERGADLREVVRSTARELARAVAQRRAESAGVPLGSVSRAAHPTAEP